eukprot:scaffold272942_cov31-Tisochrysis_lutea.AAC.1
MCSSAQSGQAVARAASSQRGAPRRPCRSNTSTAAGAAPSTRRPARTTGTPSSTSAPTGGRARACTSSPNCKPCGSELRKRPTSRRARASYEQPSSSTRSAKAEGGVCRTRNALPSSSTRVDEAVAGVHASHVATRASKPASERIVETAMSLTTYDARGVDWACAAIQRPVRAERRRSAALVETAVCPWLVEWWLEGRTSLLAHGALRIGNELLGQEELAAARHVRCAPGAPLWPGLECGVELVKHWRGSRHVEVKDL